MSQTTILIVDDALPNIRFLSQTLAQHGYKIRATRSGELALEAVHNSAPDLILLDILMPEMNGYEVCRRLKAEASTQHIPVIFLSALDAVEDKVKAFSAGGVDYIPKPFQVEEVLARVETHLALRELQKNLQFQNIELQNALDNIKTLSSLLTICSSCKKIRGDNGSWLKIEKYFKEHANADCSHVICPDCAKKMNPEYYEKTR